MLYLIQSKERYFYTGIRNNVIIDNGIGVSDFIAYIAYRVFPKNTITAGICDINTHLPQNIYTGYPQGALFTLNFYCTAQKSR